MRGTARNIAADVRAGVDTDTGAYAESVTVETGSVDVHVVSHDPAAHLIEYGYTTEDGRRVEGQHPMTRAAAKAARR